MRENWVATNRRALGFGAVAPLVVAMLGGWLASGLATPDLNWPRWLGAAIVAAGGLLFVSLVVQMRRPRVAYEAGRVSFHLRSGTPIDVPVELVEAFFLGQGPLALPGAPQGDSTVNLVARISQRDPSYAEREVKPALGAWCDSYVTIRGTWCEPLDGELIRRLNRRLREVTEQSRAATG
jgi:hypothetical protein